MDFGEAIITYTTLYARRCLWLFQYNEPCHFRKNKSFTGTYHCLRDSLTQIQIFLRNRVGHGKSAVLQCVVQSFGHRKIRAQMSSILFRLGSDTKY